MIVIIFYAGDSAFASCTSLTTVIIPTSVTVIGSVGYQPQRVTGYGDYYDLYYSSHGPFTSCTSLKSISIPNSVTAIGFYY